MSGSGEQSLFFLSLPDLRKLCCVTLFLKSDDPELRNKQVKTSRGLLLCFPDINASPVLGSFSEILVVMAITFFKKGIIQAFTQRHSLEMGAPQRVLPGTLQMCLSYSLTSRLAPNWNKAGQYLIAGKDFLSESGKMNAIGMELSASESQLCISVEASTVRLPPARLEDFDIPPVVLKNFHSHSDAVIQTSMCSNWCFILPSMKKGQITSISHQLPRESPFQSYADLQNHWNSLYGYWLPDIDEEEVIYCSVFFKLVGERLFTYPLSCIRTVPVQRCPRVDLQGALGSFIPDLRHMLQSVCGFPARMTSKPCYHTTNLTTPASAQGSAGKPVNLTTKSASRPVLIQLPAPCPLKPLFGPAPARPALPSNLPGGQNYGRSQISAVQTQATYPRATAPTSDTPQSQGSSSSSSSSSFSSSSLYPSPVIPARHPTPSRAQTQNSGPKLVPIFKNKALTRHVNVTQLLAQKQQRRGEEPRASVLGQKRLGPAFSSSSSSSSFSSFSSSSTSSSSSSIPSSSSSSSYSSGPSSLFSSSSIKRTQDTHRPRPGSVVPGPERVTLHPSQGRAPTARDEMAGAGGPSNPPPLSPSKIPSKRGGDWFESKPKKHKSAVQDVDVEKYARSNQLSKVNVATLGAWLKSKGVAVRSRDKKEELVSKVMGCLTEP